MRKIRNIVKNHRVEGADSVSVCAGRVQYAPAKSFWFLMMLAGAAAGVAWFPLPSALALFAAVTAVVLLFGHSLGSHRKLIHNSFACPRWLEYLLVWLGVQVGLAGPIGLLRQHELRDFAQRQRACHPYLRHGAGFWRDAWWQLHCELVFERAPAIRIERRIADDAFYRFLDRTWMLQQLPLAVLFYLLGGWAFVCWGVCARIVAGVSGHWLIGYYAHNHGELAYEIENAAVQGRNLRWTSLLTMGEGWHNNHHAFPHSARLGLAKGEWDPGWWALRALEYVGLVRDLHLPDRIENKNGLDRCRFRPFLTNLWW